MIPYLHDKVIVRHRKKLWIGVVLMPIRIRIRLSFLMPIRIRISFITTLIHMRILLVPQVVQCPHVGKRFFLLLFTAMPVNNVFSFLISGKYLMILYFGQHIEILMERNKKISVADRDPGSGAFFTPESIRDPGWVKSQDPDPGSGMNNPDHIS
jgi:hypothetical protein